MPLNQGSPSPQTVLQSSVIESQAVHVAQLKGVIEQYAGRIKELETAIETLTQAAKDRACSVSEPEAVVCNDYQGMAHSGDEICRSGGFSHKSPAPAYTEEDNES